MTSSNQPTPNERIEKLVRELLDQEAAKVDAARILQGVKERQATPRSMRNWKRLVGITTGIGVAAAAILIMLLWGAPPSTAIAGPETWIQEARTVHAGPVDRCYEIQTRWETNIPRPPFAPGMLSTQLWTRGDRFYISSHHVSEPRRFAWGRDEERNIWVSPSPRLGMSFLESELDEGVVLACDMMSMQVDSLLTDLLFGFNLRFEESSANDVVRIVAIPKPHRPHPRLRQVTLEVDAESKVLRKVELRRVHKGIAAAVVTFSLLEESKIPDERYQLRGHLDSDARVFAPGKDPRNFRQQWLRNMWERKLPPPWGKIG